MPALTWADIVASTGGVLPTVPPPPAAEAPNGETALDVMSAALHQNNLVTNVYDVMTQDSAPPAQAGYSPFEGNAIAGYEQYADRFVLSQSPGETEQIKGRITAETHDKKAISQAGGWGLTASLAAGTIDPLTIASMAVPVAGPAAWAEKVGRLTRIAGSVAAAAALDTVDEVALHAAQETRTVGDSVLRIGAGSLLNGVFGAIASRVPKTEFDVMRKQVAEDLARPRPPETSTAGAMAVGANTTLADEGIASGAGLINKTLGRASPLVRLLSSPVKQVRQMIQRRADIPFLLGKNVNKGLATETAVETFIRQRISKARVDVIQTLDKEYLAYSKEAGVNGGAVLSRRDFGIEVSRAMRQGDRSALGQVNTVARKFREIIDQDRKDLVAHGVLPEDAKLLGAESYLPRMYDFAAITRNLPGFKAVLRKWYMENPYSAELRKTMEEVAAKKGVAPNTVFHGTNRAFENFDVTRAEQNAIFFTDSEVEAQKFAGMFTGSDTKNVRVIAAHADLKNPTTVDWGGGVYSKTRMDDILSAARLAGHDGVVVKNIRNFADSAPTTTTAVFNGKSVRPAVSNAPVLPQLDPAEIDARVNDTVDTILGSTRDMADLGKGTSNPKITRARTLDVPDELLEPFLENDFERIVQGYLRSVAPQIEMRKMFGSVDIKDEIQQIADAYGVKMQGASAKEQQALQKQMTADIRDFSRIHLRNMGHVGVTGSMNRTLVRASNILRGYNYVRNLGAMAISSISDIGHVVTRYGLARTGAMTAKFLTNVTANKLARADAKRMGTALDFWLDTRGKTLAEIGDEIPSGAVESFVHKATGQFSKLSGMATWNSSIKTISTMLEQDAIARLVKNPNSMSAFTRGKFAQHGIGESDFAALRQQIEAHSTDDSGLFRMRTELWTDQTLAAKVEGAIEKSAELMSVSRGHGDMPIFMDGQAMKVLFQFKSFAIASVNRIMTPVAQGVAHGDLATINGAATMLALGGLSYVLKEHAAGRQPELTPKRLIMEGLNWSGLLGYVPDIWDPIVANRFRNLPGGIPDVPRFSRFAGSDPINNLLGPSVGTFADFYDVYSMGTKENDKGQRMIHQLRKMLPYQNLFYTRRLVDGLEGELGEALNVSGSTPGTFMGRLMTETPPQTTEGN